jgi:hypothetical protein
MAGRSTCLILAGAALLGACALTANACAQSVSNGGNFNAGYGRVAGQENQPANPQLRDANGNLLIIDGVIQHGAGATTLAMAGAAGQASGAATGQAQTSFGDHLVVMTQGNWKTVIVGAPVANSETFSSTGDLNGKIDLDGPN